MTRNEETESEVGGASSAGRGRVPRKHNHQISANFAPSFLRSESFVSSFFQNPNPKYPPPSFPINPEKILRKSAHETDITSIPMAKPLKNGLVTAGRSSNHDKERLARVDPNRRLTEAEALFVKCVAEDGMSDKAACRVAFPHLKNPSARGCMLAKKPNVAAAIADRKAIVAQTSGMTKKRVIDGFLEAIDMARTQAEPLVMISGWREIGKMCGFYEPTRAELTISVAGQRTLARLEGLRDEELLQLVQEGPDAIDAEFEEVSTTLRKTEKASDDQETAE